MNLKKKILAITIGPVLILGIITILFTVTMVKNSMMDEIKDALKEPLPQRWQHMTRIPRLS